MGPRATVATREPAVHYYKGFSLPPDDPVEFEKQPVQIQNFRKITG